MPKPVSHSRRVSSYRTNYGRRLFVEPLEPRRLLATLATNGKSMTYTDVDFDTVTVAFSKAVLTSSNVNNVFKFDSGNVNGSNASRQQLELIDLQSASGASGVNITITAKPGADGGDGLVNVGFIDGDGINLGAVSVHGDLGRILAGTGTSATLGLTSLSVLSMGRYGINTQQAGGSLDSVIQGELGKLTVTSDLVNEYINATGPGGNVLGRIGSVNIGGSVIGGSDNNSGSIQSQGTIGNVNIKGDLEGGQGNETGYILSQGTMGNVSIGGSLMGGNSGSHSGEIKTNQGAAGAISIAQDLLGGSTTYSGQIDIEGKITSVKIGGSMVGGTNGQSANIISNGNIGSITIGGNLQGDGNVSGAVLVQNGKLGSIRIGGSVTGNGYASGYIQTAFDLGSVQIGRLVDRWDRDRALERLH